MLFLPFTQNIAWVQVVHYVHIKNKLTRVLLRQDIRQD